MEALLVPIWCCFIHVDLKWLIGTNYQDCLHFLPANSGGDYLACSGIWQLVSCCKSLKILSLSVLLLPIAKNRNVPCLGTEFPAACRNVTLVWGMIIFPGNALSGLLSCCSIGEDRDWEKAQMEGHQELNLIFRHSVAVVSASAQTGCNVWPLGRPGVYHKVNEPNHVKMVLKRPHHVLYLLSYGTEML